MSQKIALVTGANRGIGLETAKQLCLAGVHTYLGVRSSEQGKLALAQLAADGVKASIVELDVTNPASHAAVYGFLNSHHGKLDILVNNAGIAGGSFPGEGPEHNAADVPMDLLHRVFETNFFSLVALTKTLLPLIRKSAAGRIVNLASILGSLQLHATPGSPIYDSKSFAYDASKTAVNAYTVHLAYELRDTKIKVNSAHPGWVKTDMGGSDAMMEIVDGAKTSVELALLGDDGPTGGFFHLGQPLPW